MDAARAIELLLSGPSGIEAWNAMRSRDTTPPRLRGARLSSARLEGANLSHIDLRDADLTSSDLRRADLAYANLAGADLTFAQLQGVDLQTTNIERAILSHAYLSDAQLSGLNLSRLSLSAADLLGAYLEDVTLSRANLQNARLRGAHLSGDLTFANCQGADFSQSTFGDIDFSGADLRRACLCNVDIFGQVNFDRANLRGSTIGHTFDDLYLFDDRYPRRSLSGIDFSGADLRDSVFCLLDVSEARFHGTNLAGADLRGCNLRCSEFRDANLSGANLSDSDLTLVRFISTDLSGALLDRALVRELQCVDLRGLPASPKVLRLDVHSDNILTGDAARFFFAPRKAVFVVLDTELTAASIGAYYVYVGECKGKGIWPASIDFVAPRAIDGKTTLIFEAPNESDIIEHLALLLQPFRFCDIVDWAQVLRRASTRPPDQATIDAMLDLPIVQSRIASRLRITAEFADALPQELQTSRGTIAFPLDRDAAHAFVNNRGHAPALVIIEHQHIHGDQVTIEGSAINTAIGQGAIAVARDVSVSPVSDRNQTLAIEQVDQLSQRVSELHLEEDQDNAVRDRLRILAHELASDSPDRSRINEVVNFLREMRVWLSHELCHVEGGAWQGESERAPIGPLPFLSRERAIEMLRLGHAKEWNRLRRMHLEKELPDLTGIVLSGGTLSIAGSVRGIDLRWVNLGYAVLSNSDLENANMQQANLRGADVSGANLAYANLGQAVLDAARCSGTCLYLATLTGAMARGANLTEADLSLAILRGGDFVGAIFRRAFLVGVDLREADLTRANLEGARLDMADCRKARLFGAHLEGAVLGDSLGAECEGEETDCSSADMRECVLREATLQNVILARSRLGGADLTKANLIGADFTNADLRGAVLRDANLEGANLSGAVFNGADLSGAQLDDAVVYRTRFCDLRGFPMSPKILRLGGEGRVLKGDKASAIFRGGGV